MDIEDHVKLQKARISSLNGKISTARALGEIDRLAELETELAQAEQTLERLLKA